MPGLAPGAWNAQGLEHRLGNALADRFRLMSVHGCCAHCPCSGHRHRAHFLPPEAGTLHFRSRAHPTGVSPLPVLVTAAVPHQLRFSTKNQWPLEHLRSCYCYGYRSKHGGPNTSPWYPGWTAEVLHATSATLDNDREDEVVLQIQVPSNQVSWSKSKHSGYINYNNSLTWIEAIWGWFPLLTMIPVRSQWGRYNLPRNICFSAVLLATLSYPRLHEGLPHPAAKLGYEYLSKQRQVKSHQIMLII